MRASRDPLHNKSGPTPAKPPERPPICPPELRERLGQDLADLLDDALELHPDLASAMLPPTAADRGRTEYAIGMWERAT